MCMAHSKSLKMKQQVGLVKDQLTELTQSKTIKISDTNECNEKQTA